MWMSHPNAHYVSAAFPHCKIVFLTRCSQKCDSKSRVDRTLCSLMIHSAPGPEYNVNMCLDFFFSYCQKHNIPCWEHTPASTAGLVYFFLNFFVCFQFFVSVRLFPVLFTAERNSQRKKRDFSPSVRSSIWPERVLFIFTWHMLAGKQQQEVTRRF